MWGRVGRHAFAKWGERNSCLPIVAVPGSVFLFFVGIVGFAVKDFERVPCIKDDGVLVSPSQILFPRKVLCAYKAFERACVLPPVPC